MYENGKIPDPAAPASAPAPKQILRRQVVTGIVVAFVAVLSLSLIGIGTASAAPTGSHAVASSNGGGSGSGGDGGTWDQTKVPLPHLPDQAPVFVLQSQTVADVVALDQTSEAAADASMIAFYQDNTACTVDTHAKPNVQDTIICPKGTATTTDAFAGGTWIHVFRLVN